MIPRFGEGMEVIWTAFPVAFLSSSNRLPPGSGLMQSDFEKNALQGGIFNFLTKTSIEPYPPTVEVWKFRNLFLIGVLE